jgi:hypothetical protein
MKTRTINALLLKQAIKQRGEGGLAQLARATHVSVSWLQKASTGNYEGVPREITRGALCRETGFNEDQLFPFVSAKGRARAS